MKEAVRLHTNELTEIQRPTRSLRISEDFISWVEVQVGGCSTEEAWGVLVLLLTHKKKFIANRVELVPFQTL